MPDPSKISQLPEELRGELDATLIGNGFSGHVALSEWLASKGFEISKSAVGRHSKALKEALNGIKVGTEAARLINREVGDDPDDRAAATIALLQTQVFNTLLFLRQAEEEDDPAERAKVLSKVARAIADLTRASVTQKKYAEQVRAKAAAAADAAEQVATKGGLSPALVNEIKESILGIAR